MAELMIKADGTGKLYVLGHHGYLVPLVGKEMVTHIDPNDLREPSYEELERHRAKSQRNNLLITLHLMANRLARQGDGPGSFEIEQRMDPEGKWHLNARSQMEDR